MMEIVSEERCFGGVQGVYRHRSETLGVPMTFAVFSPPQAAQGRTPALWYLSGLTCTHENAMTKAGAQGWAAQRGLTLVFPDTSPRGEDVADDPAFDLGQGAGFYVDATESPWAAHFRMYSYVTCDLQALVTREFAVDPERQGVTGHSMGGHGALTLAMRHPDLYRSLSAFAPIALPSGSDWGRKQMLAYLGPDEARWRDHDATMLMRDCGWPRDLLIDQGTEDPFIDLLKPEALVAAIAARRQPATFRMQAGYSHGYDFVASFMRDHIDWHADRL